MFQKFHCEHVLYELNDFDCYQKTLIFGFILPMVILIAFQSNFVYNIMIPDHWCRVDLLVNFSYGEQSRFIRPRLKSLDDAGNNVDLDDSNVPMDNLNNADHHHLENGFNQKRLSNCEMFDIDYQEVINGLNLPNRKNRSIVIPIKRCSRESGWVYDRNQFKENAAMFYNFVCDQSEKKQIISFLRKLSSALFSLLYAILSDRFGRKTGLFSLLVAYILSSIAPVLTTNYYAFLACQFLSGSCWPIGLILVIVIGIEFITPSYRSDVIALAAIAFQFGEWFSFIIVRQLSHWVWIATFNTLIVIPFFLFYQYCDESPHWLLANKRFKALKDLFEKINRINSARLDSTSIQSIINKFANYYRYDRPEEISATISMQNLRQSTSKNHLNGHINYYSHRREHPPNWHRQQSHRNYRQKTINVLDGFRNTKYDSYLGALSSKEIENSNDEDDEDDGRRDSCCRRGRKDNAMFRKIHMFIKRSSLFQMIFLWSIVMITNELIIDFLRKNQSNHLLNDPILIDRILISFSKMLIILVSWFLVNSWFGRRWSNCIFLALNLCILILLMFAQSLIKRNRWLNIVVHIIGSTLAECSELITILQTIELTSTRYRLVAAAIVHSLSQAMVLLIIFWLYNHHESSNRSLSTMSSEEAIEYLSQKYSNRYGPDDLFFKETINRNVQNPPIEINYVGRIYKRAQRNFQNNQRNHHNRF
ncbi:Solute carrier family 22 member 1 [Sarcoptes scabiei]|uniref:Solute carrier family 22 member 1 n=1 Tax=Sarcoptes scabiei TaxID=52283 RepID=A0A834REM3_SARSC|nr:Solute carrier family 22 member 1 [Sarcoptes scabiei]